VFSDHAVPTRDFAPHFHWVISCSPVVLRLRGCP
jgi:hypothetical protein